MNRCCSTGYHISAETCFRSVQIGVRIRIICGEDHDPHFYFTVGYFFIDESVFCDFIILFSTIHLLFFFEKEEKYGQDDISSTETYKLGRIQLI